MTPASAQRFNTVPLALRLAAVTLVCLGFMLWPVTFVLLVMVNLVEVTAPAESYIALVLENFVTSTILGAVLFCMGMTLMLIIPRAHNRWPVFRRALTMVIRRSYRAFIAWVSSPHRMLRTLLWLVLYLPPTIAWSTTGIIAVWLPRKWERRWMMYLAERSDTRRRRINRRLTAWGF